VSSIANPTAGTVTSATASCPTGRVLLGGGGQVSDGPIATGSTTTTAANSATSGTGVALLSSYPTTTTARGWRAVGVVTGPLTTGMAMSVQAYVICGTP
jgi:hypothetical protein